MSSLDLFFKIQHGHDCPEQLGGCGSKHSGGTKIPQQCRVSILLPIGGLLEIKNELVRYNSFIIFKVATLNKATAYIFTDMQTAERHGHAGECYETTAKRCGALLQWINMVRGSDKILILTSFVT